MTTETVKDVGIQVATAIQARVAQWSAEGRDIYADGIAAPYAEGFYDNCILYWEEGFFDVAQVKETVESAIAELIKVYA